MLVVTNRIPVATGYEEAFEKRFADRAGLVDSSPGFVRSEIHRAHPMIFDRTKKEWVDVPTTPTFYEVKTWWGSLDDFVAWTGSESFREAHSNPPPKEMFAGPNELAMHEVL